MGTVNHEPSPQRFTVPTKHIRRFTRPAHFGAMVRRAASRAISVRELTSSFFRMWETWVATVRRDSSSLAAISGLDNPSST